MSRPMLTREAFLAKFQRVGACLEWQGARTGEGYGVVRVSGVLTRTHILSWETHHGKPVPAGKILRHTCDNPPCGDPAHLIPGDHGDNLSDQWFRKRRKARTREQRQLGV